MCCVQMCPATLNPVVIPRSASVSLNWNNPCRRKRGGAARDLQPEPVSWWVQFNPLCDSDLSLAARWDHLNPAQWGHLVGYWGGRLIRLAGPRGLSEPVRLTVRRWVLLEGDVTPARINTSEEKTVPLSDWSEFWALYPQISEEWRGQPSMTNSAFSHSLTAEQQLHTTHLRFNVLIMFLFFISRSLSKPSDQI